MPVFSNAAESAIDHVHAHQDVVTTFLARTNLDLVARAHQVRAGNNCADDDGLSSG